GAGMDQLELGQPAEDVPHQPPMGRRVDRWIAEGAEPGLVLFGDSRERVRHVAAPDRAASRAVTLSPPAEGTTASQPPKRSGERASWRRGSNDMLPFRCSAGYYNRSRSRRRPSVRTAASGAIVLIASCSAARFS